MNLNRYQNAWRGCMNKIQINSIEAVILFILYICAQDDVITEEELEHGHVQGPEGL